MFFLKQIKQQFILTLSAQNGEGAAAAIDQHYEQNQAANDNVAPNPNEQQGPPTAEALAFQELNEELDAIDNNSTLVNTYTNILGNFLVKVRRGEIQGLSEEDSDFQRLLNLYKNKFEELKDMRNRGQEIEHVIAYSMSQLQETVDRGVAGEDIDDAIDKAYEAEVVEREGNEEIERLEIRRTSLSNIISEQLSHAPIGFSVSRDTESVISAIENLSHKTLESTTLDGKKTELKDINSSILTLIESIDIEHQIQLFQRKEVDGLNVPLNETEKIEMNNLNTEYFAYIEALEIKLNNFISTTDNTTSMTRVIELYKQLNSESVHEMTDREKLLFFQEGAVEDLGALHRLADIALRDEGVINEQGDKLGEERIDSAHQAYEKILENEEIKSALTTNAGETPSFEELDMSDINILVDKGVSLAELFLVNQDGENVSGEIIEGNSYLINFSTNTNLEGKIDFAYIAKDTQKIIVDGKELTFDENSFKLDGEDYKMKDGSKIDVVANFEDEGTPVQTQRHEQINDLMENQGIAANHQRIITEALASSNPQAAFEGATLPGGLAGFFVAMILNFGDGRNFEYNVEKNIWEDIDENEPLTNEGIINENRGVYYSDTGQRVDISSSFEDLPPGVGSLVNTIYQAESRGNPDIIYGGCPIQPSRPITQMTVGEVRRFQDEMVRAGSASSAVGACQIIRTTMDGAIAAGVLTRGEKFDVAAQNKFTLWKMNERGLGEFMAGRKSEDAFMRSLSQEWASLPKDDGGASYYAGDGLNHALVSPQTMRRHLREIGQG